MKSWFKILIVLLFSMLASSCYEIVEFEDEEYQNHVKNILKINQFQGFLDLEKKHIYYPIHSDTTKNLLAIPHYYSYDALFFNGEKLVLDKEFDFGKINAATAYELLAVKNDVADTFHVFFSSLPLVRIHTESEIRDEPKVYSEIEIQASANFQTEIKSTVFKSRAGVEIRGATSKKYEKKSLGIELWKNISRDNNPSALLGMALSEDYILDAMYIDPLRLRNKISYEIWAALNRVPDSYSNSGPVKGIKTTPVELFINDSYHGIYNLSENLDNKLFQYIQVNNLSETLIYKAFEWGDGSVTFENYLSPPPNEFTWDGWEQIYPKDDSSWNALSGFRKFIIESSDDEFRQGIGDYLNIDNALNYYLFINLLRAQDNSGKNLYLIKYSKDSTFYFVPWDIEASWGCAWTGIKISHIGISSNRLFERLLQTNALDFSTRLPQMWSEYRATIFSMGELMANIDRSYHSIAQSGAIERENNRWKEVDISYSAEYEFIKTWIHKRLNYLDEYFIGSTKND